MAILSNINNTGFTGAQNAALQNAESQAPAGSTFNNTVALSSPGGTPSPYTLSGDNAYSGASSNLNDNGLNASLNSAFDNSGQQQSIMDSYNSQVGAAGNAAGTAAQSLTDYYSGQSAYEQAMGMAANQKGIADSKGLINPGAMQIIQDQSTKLLSDLNKQMNDALSNNQAELASTIANAKATEITNMVTARQNFLTNYFSSQQETRAEAGFNLDQQQKAADVRNALATGQLTQAQAELTLKQIGLNSAQIQEALAAAGASSASASLSSAQARQANTITGFFGSPGTNLPSTDPDVQYLLNGGTVAGLQARYAGTPQAVRVPSIIQSAQSYGYNQNNANLNYTGAENNASNLGSGGISGAGTATTNLLGNFLNFSSPKGGDVASGISLNPAANPSVGTVAPGPNGSQYKWDGTSWNIVQSRLGIPQ